MNNSFAIGYLALSLAACLAAAEVRGGDVRGRRFDDYRVVSVSVDHTVKPPLQKVDAVVQVGTNPVNQFTMHHVYHRHGLVKGSVILVPSLVNNFNEYMIGEEHGTREALAVSLAHAHYDVYGYSPRTSHLGPHACTAGGVDCSVMKDWNIGTYVRDVEFIRTYAMSAGYKPVVGGLSLGAFVGIAAVNGNPSGYSGLLMWEGAMYSTDPTVIELSSQNCSNLNAAISTGIYYEENLPLTLKDLAKEGESATISFFGVPQPTVSGTPNWIQLVPDASATHYEVAWFPRVLDFIAAFNNVESLPVISGISCSLAGDRTYTADLGKFRAPILAIEAGQGFGPYMQQTIDLTSSNNVRIEADQAFGHLDGYLTLDYETYTVNRILKWLKADVFRH
jgi:pimeloyl-ACP methyl ester carboxylesterase